ncbi:hypothetical protein ACHAW5_007030 [Stephanodiscus triporus]|uniref:PDZ domain-containing protein n=1 Tax=Stephanodiscus triporus TaxID=2934178 RepID=A0ABD3NWR1_9STRA
MDQANEDSRRDANNPQQQDLLSRGTARHGAPPPTPTRPSTHPPQMPMHHSHRLASSDDRRRDVPPPPNSSDGTPGPASLDPTGMFRNRGRRVIARSRTTEAQRNHNNGTVIFSSASLPPPSPPKGRRHRDDRDIASVDDRIGDELDDHGRKHRAWRERGTFEGVTTADPTESKSRSEGLSPMPPDVMHVDCRESGDPGRLIPQEEPENDHPPQSMSLMNVSKSGNDISGHTQNFDADEILESDNALNDGRNIATNRSNDSGDGKYAPSAVGSTVSIMGSIVGDGDYSSAYDDARLLAVKRRMMQDVEEVLDEEIDGDQREHEGTIHENDGALNTSLECHADTNTSYLEDHSDVGASSTERDGGDYLSEEHSVTRDADMQQHPSNLMKFADFCTTPSINNICDAHEPQNRQEQESPFRAAFRRGAQGMSNRLPPMSPQMLSAAVPSESLKRLTPSRFQRSSASSTASLLPQFARQCFSFEDTTVDDDIFLAMRGVGGHPTTHKYYGLSAVASSVIGEHDDRASDDDHRVRLGVPTRESHVPKRETPSHRTRLSWEEPESQFRAIRESRTWAGSIPQASSFGASSPTRSGSNQPLGNDINGTGDSLAIDEVKYNSVEKDWKKLEMERGDAINLLACMVEHLLSFEHQESEGSHDDLELDKLKLIANSMKQISAAVNDIISESNGEQSIASSHQMRSDVIDTLLRSHEFALEAKRSSQSAKKWLQSIGQTKTEISCNKNIEWNHSMQCDDLRTRLTLAENYLSCKEDEINRLNEELSCCRSEIGRLKSSSFQSQQQPMPLSMNKSILSSSSSDSNSTDNILKGSGSLVLCSPRPTVKLSESQDESFLKWEKDIEHQMNLESRKEILLLKAALEKANRKICALENKTEDPFASDIEPINASSDHGREELFMKIAADIENDALVDTPVSDQGDNCTNNDTNAISPAIKLDDPALEKELEEYRQALVVSLEHERTKVRADSITSSEDPNLAQDLSKSNSSDRKMINVRMIDGENFSTEWSDLVDLPPPPDHALHSPIVDAVLREWSDNNETRSALMGWLEDILNGPKLVHSVPSLKLTGLDHQTRDGFVMHVLPLLLHRKDIHVHLTSRAHRKTSYDIAVQVTPTSFGVQKHERLSDSASDDVESRPGKFSSKHHLMAFQATKNGSHSIKENIDVSKSPIPFLPVPFMERSVSGLARSFSNAGSISTAVTTPISNLTPTRGTHMARMTDRYTSLSAELKTVDFPVYRDEYAMSAVASPSLGDDLSVGSSAVDDDNKESQRQSGIIGSISGALGLLSRRKASPVENESLGASPRFHTSMVQTPKRNSSEDEHSYHRIVSAPPGKIGISFVEYRGHAMVSNVSEDSPLVGWVFPSDVLIAIDDIPVSGLRTRDIVKLLTNRVKQQRNLRMVSAVAMNELTRPGTV